jgi:contact-dependent growth inhibition (CDI) system restriction endonuclease-like protein
LAGTGLLLGTPQGPSSVWKLGWGLRGQKINELFGDPTFPSNYPVTDKIPNGVATSVKSIDLNAATYQNEASLANRLNKLIDDVREFNGVTWGGLPISDIDIKGRAVQVIVPRGSITEANRAAFDRAQARAWGNNEKPVDIIVTEY